MEEILSVDLSVLLSYVVWLPRQSRAEIDGLQSCFQLGGTAMLRPQGDGQVLGLAGRAGWRGRAPLRDNGSLRLLGSVRIHKALGNPVGTKEFIMSISHFQELKD